MRRGSVANLMQQPGMSGRALQDAWTQRVEVIVDEMFQEALGAKALPCQYAFCLAGSGARHEASPYSNQGKRDAELAILNAKSAVSRTEAEKERHTRLTAGTLMTRAEVKDLTDVIPNLAFIMALARTFVKEKEKALGKRGNPFV
jgi:hypothetical protein